MKKLLFLIASVILISYSCNNKPATDTAVTTDTVAVVNTAPVDSDTTTVGAPTVVAQVFEDANGMAIAGATVVAKESKTTIQTVTTNDKGGYACPKCSAGHSYTFTCSKTGYVTMSVAADYKDSTSLPGFALVKAKL